MGLAASQLRFLQLTSRASDIEFNVQAVNQQRTTLASQTEKNLNQIVALIPPNANDTILYPGGATDAKYIADKDKYDAQYQKYYAQSEIYYSKDRRLETELKNLDTQHKTVETETDAIKKIIDKNIDVTFKTFA